MFSVRRILVTEKVRGRKQVEDRVIHIHLKRIIYTQYFLLIKGWS